MPLHRTFSIMRHSAIFKFLKAGDLSAVEQFITKEDIFYNYLSGKPVTKDCVTRFGYLDCPVRPLYLSESADTTYYEFAYWLLKKPEEIKSGIRIATIEVDIGGFSPGEVVNDLETTLKGNVLNHTAYEHAHEWIKSFDPLPQNVIYPTVRGPNTNGTNYAIFKGNLTEHKFLNHDEYFTLGDDGISVKLSSTGEIIRPIY